MLNNFLILGSIFGTPRNCKNFTCFSTIPQNCLTSFYPPNKITWIIISFTHRTNLKSEIFFWRAKMPTQSIRKKKKIDIEIFCLRYKRNLVAILGSCGSVSRRKQKCKILVGCGWSSDSIYGSIHWNQSTPLKLMFQKIQREKIGNCGTNYAITQDFDI